MKSSPRNPNTIRSVWQNPIHFIAFGFGSGLLPKMPGTFGTLAAIPFYLIMSHFSFWLYCTVISIFALLAIFICHITAKDIGVHDYPPIVVDEMVGYFLTMLGAPLGWFWVILGFILFRLFDIHKPWPIDWLDKHVKGGFGIVLDDVGAAFYAWLVLQSGAAVVMFYE